MNGVGGYGLFVIVWGAIVAGVALTVGMFASFGDGRRRFKERHDRRIFAGDGQKIVRLFPLRLVIVLLCVVASIGTLFAVAEHTVTSVEVEHPWLG